MDTGLYAVMGPCAVSQWGIFDSHWHWMFPLHVIRQRESFSSFVCACGRDRHRISSILRNFSSFFRHRTRISLLSSCYYVALSFACWSKSCTQINWFFYLLLYFLQTKITSLQPRSDKLFCRNKYGAPERTALLIMHFSWILAFSVPWW